MISSASLGFCRSGASGSVQRLVKKYLAKELQEPDLIAGVSKIRRENWLLQRDSGIDIIPCNDLSLQDHVLDMTCLLGNIQRRYYWEGGKVPMEIYFAMAHGQQKEKFDVLPLELEYWFDKPYMFFVPEFQDPIDFAYSDNKPILEYLDAKSALKMDTRPIIIGPLTYLMLGKSKEVGVESLDLLDEILQVYKDLFANLNRIGVKRVQIDEPFLGTELSRETQNKYIDCYSKLKAFAGNVKIDLVSYYGDIRDNLEMVFSLPIDSFHIDCIENKSQILDSLHKIQNNIHISLGIVDATNVWVNNLQQSIDFSSKVLDKLGTDDITVAMSGPLFLCPYSVALEDKLPSNLKSILSFSKEKLNELNIIKTALNSGINSVKRELSDNKIAIELLSESNVDKKLDAKVDALFSKPLTEVTKKYHQQRKKALEKHTNLPTLAATLIGGFADSTDYKSIKEKNLDEAIKARIAENIDLQIKPDIDILSYGMPETNIPELVEKSISGIYHLRNNTVPYFAEFDVYPKIIHDNIEWQSSLHNKYISYAKTLLTKNKQLKACLSGPVTFVNNAFVRPSLARDKLYHQATLAIHNEMESIVNSDIFNIQINEPMMFLKLPHYVSQVTPAIREICKTVNRVYDDLNKKTRVMLYTGYADLNDTIEDICRMAVDVVLTESARSRHDILSAFSSYKPQVDIGLGLFDPKDNRIPTKQELLSGFSQINMFFDDSQLWLMPDCGFEYKRDTKDVAKSLAIFNSVIKELRGNAKSNASS